MVNWLKDDDMLPARFPDARIFTYDWPANTFYDAADDDLFGHAKTLLDKLEQHVSGLYLGKARKTVYRQLTPTGLRTTSFSIYRFVFWRSTFGQGHVVSLL